MNQKKWVQFSIAVGILIIPSLFYVILSTGKHDIARVPFYGPRQTHPTKEIKAGIPDTIYYAVPNFSFYSQENELKQLEEFKGKITVIHFFCDSCEPSVYRSLQLIQKVYERMKDKPDVHFITLITDTLPNWEKLASAKEFDLFSPNWDVLQFKTSEDAKTFATQHLLLNDTTSNGFDMSSLLVLDSEHRIRGLWNGTQYGDGNNLIDDIKALRFINYKSVKKPKNNAQ
jgi:protein SCO1/2